MPVEIFVLGIDVGHSTGVAAGLICPQPFRIMYLGSVTVVDLPIYLLESPARQFFRSFDTVLIEYPKTNHFSTFQAHTNFMTSAWANMLAHHGVTPLPISPARWKGSAAGDKKYLRKHYPDYPVWKGSQHEQDAFSMVIWQGLRIKQHLHP